MSYTDEDGVHRADRDDQSPEHLTYPSGYDSRCGWCYLNAPHSKLGHAAEMAKVPSRPPHFTNRDLLKAGRDAVEYSDDIDWSVPGTIVRTYRGGGNWAVYRTGEGTMSRGYLGTSWSG